MKFQETYDSSISWSCPNSLSQTCPKPIMSSQAICPEVNRWIRVISCEILSVKLRRMIYIFCSRSTEGFDKPLKLRWSWVWPQITPVLGNVRWDPGQKQRIKIILGFLNWPPTRTKKIKQRNLDQPTDPLTTRETIGERQIKSYSSLLIIAIPSWATRFHVILNYLLTVRP